MITHTAHYVRPVRRSHRFIVFPRIYFRVEIPFEIRRKDLWLSAFVFLAGLSIPAMMFFGVIATSFPLGLLGFALTFIGGMLLLVRWGEIA